MVTVTGRVTRLHSILIPSLFTALFDFSNFSHAAFCGNESMLDRTQDALTLIGSITMKRGCINYYSPQESDVGNGHDCSPFTINGPTLSQT